MNEEHDIIKKQEVAPQEPNRSIEAEPFIHWKSKFNEKTGQSEIDSIELSDGDKFNAGQLKAAIKRATGTSDPIQGEYILKLVANGLSLPSQEVRLNQVSALLPALHPQDETEAMLLGQFLALHDSGMRCLRNAHLPAQGFYHKERLFALAQKLFNTANQTMQTVVKYRSRGQQTMQVIHVHNEGQAIVAQNLCSSKQGSEEKINN